MEGNNMEKLLLIPAVIIILSGSSYAGDTSVHEKSANICADNFSSMRQQITNPNLIDFQRKKIIESYLGKKVVWQGWVLDVQKDEKGYVCLVDMDSSKALTPVHDFKIQVDRKLAMNLKKDQVVYVAGVIKLIDYTGEKFSVELEKPKLTTQKPESGKKLGGF
jgi:hypothetical protein